MATSPASPRCHQRCIWGSLSLDAVVEAALPLLSAPGTQIKEERLWQAGSIHPSSSWHTPCQTLALAAVLVVSPARAWAGFPPSLNQQVILLITDKAPVIKEEVLWQVPQSLAWGNGEMEEQELLGCTELIVGSKMF